MMSIDDQIDKVSTV